MASAPKKGSDREDGEIVEDEFEDISDNEFILTSKCFSSEEHLPEISLSSASEAEDIKKFKQQRYRNRRTQRKRKYSHRKTVCLDSDSDEYELDRKLLRAAIHIDNPDSLRNSLHTRLKAMTQIGHDQHKDENDCQPQEIQNQNISSDDGDDDLIQLRLEALRTAVLNKFKHRKKIKCKDISESDGFDEMFTDISEKTDDKENANRFNNENAIHRTETKNTEISSIPHPSVDTIVQNNPPDEDEDVLRALLLASLSKKISKESSLMNNKLQPSIEGDIYSHNKPVPQNDKKCIANPYKKNSVIHKNVPLQHTKVQPIIININCDSDTEEENHSSVSQVPQKIPNPSIENSVDKFLKEQRAKVEAGNTKSDGVKSEFFNKSSLKLLPKIKQIEYHNLLKKLHDAQKLKLREKKKESIVTEKHLESNSVYFKNIDHKMQSSNSKKYIRNKSSQMNSEKKTQFGQIPDLRNSVRLLHKVLKEIQTNKCERLQMQTKYTTLTSIVRKINEASVERKKYDKEIGRLLEELSAAKKKLCEIHLSISSYVKELIVKKEEIDKKSTSIPDVTTIIPYTSTPVKDQDSKTISANMNIISNDKVESFTESTNEDCGKEMSIIGNLNKKEDKCSQTSATVPKYISPLDNIERTDMDDPFSIMCPYDVDGNCRDPECVYKHY